MNFMSRKENVFTTQGREKILFSLNVSQLRDSTNVGGARMRRWIFSPFSRSEFPIFHGSFNADDEDDADAVSKPTRFDSKGGGGGKEEKGGNTQRLYRIRVIPQDMHMLQVS